MKDQEDQDDQDDQDDQGDQGAPYHMHSIRHSEQQQQPKRHEWGLNQLSCKGWDQRLLLMLKLMLMLQENRICKRIYNVQYLLFGSHENLMHLFFSLKATSKV